MANEQSKLTELDPAPILQLGLGFWPAKVA
jgi:hypothetical protein